MHLKSFSCVSSGQVWKLLGKNQINFYFWHSQEVDLQSSIRTRKGKKTSILEFLTFTCNTIFLEGPSLFNTFISSDKISTATLISKLDLQFCLNICRINFYFWHSQEVDLQSSIRTRRGQTNTLLFLTFTGNTIFLEGPCLVNTLISSDKISTATLIAKLDFQFCLNICRKISRKFKLLLIKRNPFPDSLLKFRSPKPR